MFKKKLILLLFAFALLLAACGPEDEDSNEDAVNQIYTAVAETLAAQPTATLFPTVMVVDTATVAVGSSPTPIASSPPALPTATLILATEVPCQEALYMADVTVPDGTTFAPGESFTKTWQIFNAGSCAWEADYALSFSSGEEMSGVPIALGTTIAANGQSNISVTLTAPLTTGSYTSYWQLTDSSGVKFGNAIFVTITVAGPTATSTETATETPIPTDTPVPVPTT